MANTSFRYKDIDLSFEKNPATGDIYTLTDNDAVRRSVKQLVLTALGERLFRPQVGCTVHSYLFEQMNATTILDIKRSIQDVINNFEPRANLLQVEVTDSSDVNAISIQIYFYVNNVPQPVSVTVNLERDR